MIKFFIVIAFALCSLVATAQYRYTQKLYAYKEMHSKANIFISDTASAGKSASFVNYLIYVEVPKNDTPIWKTAVIGSDIYSVHPTLIDENSVVVGERKRDKRLITIRPQAESNLWKLEFDLTGEKDVSATNAIEETVVLRGTFKNRKLSSTVRNIVELTSP